MEVAVTRYALTVGRIVLMSSPRVAEMAKLLESTFRAARHTVRLVSELVLMRRNMSVNV